MPRSRPVDPPELRRQMVEFVRAGRSPESLAMEFEPTAKSIHGWVATAGRDDGHRAVSQTRKCAGDGLTTNGRDELNRLRRENKPLKLER